MTFNFLQIKFNVVHELNGVYTQFAAKDITKKTFAYCDDKIIVSVRI